MRPVKLHQDTPPDVRARDSRGGRSPGSRFIASDCLPRDNVSPVAITVGGSPLTVAGAAAALCKACTHTAFPFDPLREPPRPSCRSITTASSHSSHQFAIVHSLWRKSHSVNNPNHRPGQGPARHCGGGNHPRQTGRARLQVHDPDGRARQARPDERDARSARPLRCGHERGGAVHRRASPVIRCQSDHAWCATP